VDHAQDRIGEQRPKAVHPRAPAPAPGRETSEQRELLELQRMAGNQAVVGALTTVQRHSLDPEQMPEDE
jgi:hypothetical protein